MNKKTNEKFNKNELEKTNNEFLELEKRYNKIQEELNNTKEELEKANNILQEIYNSKSWRLTWPLRKFIEKSRDILKKLKLNIKAYREKSNGLTNANLIKKTGHKIFIFGTVPYYDIGGGQRSAQLTKIFNKMGYSLYYIYGFKSSESEIFNIEIPAIKHKYIGEYKINEFKKDIRKDDLVIFEGPISSFDNYLNVAKNIGAKIVYENIDNWETSLGTSIFDEKTLINMLDKSDFLTATAKPLIKQLKEYLSKYSIKEKKILYLPNAVDENLFEDRLEYGKPVDLVFGKKTLIYYGSLWGSWFDWDLIYGIAKKYERYSINLIGDFEGIPERVKNAPKNIHFLGLKKQIELPAYLQHSDIALIPFTAGEITEYVSPLKIFEYIAMNKVVLSTNLPDVLDYPNVYHGDTLKEWIDILNNEMCNDFQLSKEFVLNNNWNDRCEKIITEAYPKESKKCNREFYSNISVVVLNYNNYKIIFDCIDSLLRYNKRYNYEIIVVDNQSSDGSYEELLKYKDKIKVFRNNKNGCSSGRNLGIKKSKNEYILFLDSDERVTNSYWLDSFIEVYKSSKKIKAVAWSGGWFSDEGYAQYDVESCPYRFMPPNVLGRKDIGYLATCGFLVEKDILNKINGFDEFYDPTCYEDTDLSLSIRNAGYEIVYSTHLGVFHLPHQTTQSGFENHNKLLYEKGTYFVNKWRRKNKKLLDYIK